MRDCVVLVREWSEEVWVCDRCTNLWDLLEVLAHVCGVFTCEFDRNAAQMPSSCHMLLMSQKYLYVVELMRQVSHDVVASQRHSRLWTPHARHPKIVSHLA
jgi:hypothetical protein